MTGSRKTVPINRWTSQSRHITCMLDMDDVYCSGNDESMQSILNIHTNHADGGVASTPASLFPDTGAPGGYIKSITKLISSNIRSPVFQSSLISTVPSV